MAALAGAQSARAGGVDLIADLERRPQRDQRDEAISSEGTASLQGDERYTRIDQVMLDTLDGPDSPPLSASDLPPLVDDYLPGGKCRTVGASRVECSD